MIEKYPDKTVFGNYERADVLRWINGFRYFTFARGGLNEFIDDGDEFVVSFSFDSREDLLKKLRSIGVELDIIRPGEKVFDRKKPVNESNSPALPDPITKCIDLAQPKFRHLLGVEVYIWIDEDYFWLAVSNSARSAEWWKITPADVENSLKLETLFDEAGLLPSRIYTTEEYGRFINRHNYPQYFTQPSPETKIPERRADNAN